MSPDARCAVTLAIFLASIAGVLVRPRRLPEAIWACSGAAALSALGLVTPLEAWTALLKGGDVYLFLTGMMLLAELARSRGVFDWLATHAAGWAHGSPGRLFTLIYLAAIPVTVFLSNDATAVVMTPAVYAAARRAEADPLPALFACALVANAASFVLPISNPANLVLFGGALPRLGAWLGVFALPSFVALGATYAALRFVERDRLRGACRTQVGMTILSRDGRIALAGLVIAALLLLVASALGRPLGLPTFLVGAGTTLVLLGRKPRDLRAALAGVTWSVLPLVAGLFVLVAGLEKAGIVTRLAMWLGSASAHDPLTAAAGAGAIAAVAGNLANNLPVGLVASTAIAHTHLPRVVIDALLIGVDLGPNLSITGSLATILWLAAIRREGEDVTFWRFLRVGLVVMPPALVLALAARIAIG